MKYGGEEAAKVTLNKSASSESIDSFDIEWTEGFEHSGITPELTKPESLTAGQNYSVSFALSGFEKFDANGIQIPISVEEIAIIASNGVPVPVQGGRATVDGVTYAVSSSINDPYYPGPEHHNSPDVYTTQITNTRTGGYNLVSYKVWRDDKTLVRPNVAFAVYRVSAAENPELLGLINAGDGEALAAAVADCANDEHLVDKDKVWNTRINDFLFKCNIDGIDQYDENGYPYVYFGVETISTGESGVYKGYYANKTAATEGYRPDESVGDTVNDNGTERRTKTQDVYLLPNSEMSSAAGSVFILSDGVNKPENGSFADYYSATVVNRPEKTCYVEGKKLWKLPQSWIVDQSELPSVEVSLYRVSGDKPAISYSACTSSEDYKSKVIEAAELFPVEGQADNKIIAKTTVPKAGDTSHSYTYLFDKDFKGVLLEKYDEFGSVYHYYTIESQCANTSFKTEYIDNDYSMINVYTPEPPYAEVTVSKTWKISADVPEIADLTGLTFDNLYTSGLLDKLAPVSVTLYGKQTDKTGAVYGSETSFGTIVLKPNDTARDTEMLGSYSGAVLERNAANSIVSITSSFTFKRFYNDSDKDNPVYSSLPYLSINGTTPVSYTVKEIQVGGYQETGSVENVRTVSKDVVFDGKTVDETVHYNTSPAEFVNTYIGEYTSLNFEKNWDDAYVDNSKYRPDSIEFVIKRHPASIAQGVADPLGDDFNNQNVTIRLTTANSDGDNKWKLSDVQTYTVGTDTNPHKFLKYAPDGSLYVYYVDSETVNGNYVLASKTGRSVTNKLRDDLETSVSGSKKWTINGKRLSDYAEFKSLLDLGSLPAKVQYIVQRKLASETDWSYVDATDYNETYHKIVSGEKKILGREVDLTKATATNFTDWLNVRFSWNKLPKWPYDGDSENPYEYRLLERLIWPDGLTEDICGSGGTSKGVTASVEQSGSVFSFTNDVASVKVQLVKHWSDDYGYDNNRPSSITLSIQPTDAAGAAIRASRSYELTPSGISIENRTADIEYASEVFYLSSYDVNPSSVEYFKITETLNYSESFTGTKENYTVTIGNTSLTGSNPTYSAVINVKDANPFTYENGKYKVNIINTLNTSRKTISLAASKAWSGDDSAWKSITRPDVYFKLQFKSQAGNWTDFSASNPITDFTAAQSAPAVIQKVYDSESGASAAASWAGLYKHWKSNARDGIRELIEYRAVECDINGNAITDVPYTASNNGIVNYSFTDAYNEYFGSVTNTFSTTRIKLTKNWTGESAGVKSIVRPDSVAFKLQYRLVDSRGATVKDYADIPDGTISGVSNSIAVIKPSSSEKLDDSWVKRVYNAPKFDKAGNSIEYKVTEAYITYGDTVVNAAAASAGAYKINNTALIAASGNNFSVTAENELVTAPLTLEKLWNAENNRDNLSVTVNVYLVKNGQNVPIKQNVVLNKQNGWKVSFSDLPLYDTAASAHDDSERCSYVVVETVPAGNTAELRVKPESAGSVTQNTATVKLNSSSSAYVSVVMTNTYTPAAGSIKASKSWADNDNAFSTRPSSIQVHLEYLDPKTGAWTEVVKSTLDASGNYPDGYKAYTTSDVSQTISSGETGWSIAQWDDLRANILKSNGESAQPDSIPAQYRVVEDLTGKTLEHYSVSYSSASVQLEKAGDEKTVTVTNTLKTTSLNLSKTFINYGKDASLVQPDKVEFSVEYRLGQGDWAPIPDDWKIAGISGGKAVLSSADNYSRTFEGLPLEDLSGSKYSYRAAETGLIYSQTVSAVASGSFTGSNWAGTAGAYTSTVETSQANDGTWWTATAENVLQLGRIAVKKTWTDNQNRDGLESPITVTLYRGQGGSRETVGQPVVLNNSNNWQASFENLELYTKDGPAFYTLSESGAHEDYTLVAEPQGVTLIEAADHQSSAEFENWHDIYLFDIEASKVWNDNGNNTGLRPNRVKFKLQWSVTKDDADSWSDSFDTASNDSGTNVFITAGTPEQELVFIPDEPVPLASWGDVPANVKVNTAQPGEEAAYETKPVFYRVIETSVLPSYSASIGGPVSYSDAAKDSNTAKSAAHTEITNTLDGLTYLEVTKTFADSDNKYETRPESIRVRLQYRLKGSEADFTDLPNPAGGFFEQDLNAANGWQCRFLNLPSAEDPNTSVDTLPDSYEYRAREISLQYRLSADEAHSYTVAGTDAGNYTVSYSDGTIASTDGETVVGYRTDITNSLPETSLSISKIWDDESDRDHMRPAELTFNLYRDAALIDTQTVTAGEDGSFSFTWTGLPIYKSDITSLLNKVKSVYRVEEVAVENYDEAAYDPGAEVSFAPDELTRSVAVTNHHDIVLFSVRATKSWDDNEDDYGLRPDSVELKLQYRDLEGEWADVPVGVAADETGKAVYTSSELVQTLTKADALEGSKSVWGFVQWNDLPAFRIGSGGESEKVTYRVVENEPDSTIYGTVESAELQYSDSLETVEGVLTASGSVVNPLNGLTYACASKQWVNKSSIADISKYLPNSVIIQLQYRGAETDGVWKPVPSNVTSGAAYLSSENGWKHSFEDLPLGYDYRVIEVALIYSTYIVNVNSFAATEENLTNVKVGSFVSSSVTVPVTDGEGGIKGYQAELTNTFHNRPKTGDEVYLGFFAASALVSLAGIGGGLGAIGRSRRKKKDK